MGIRMQDTGQKPIPEMGLFHESFAAPAWQLCFSSKPCSPAPGVVLLPVPCAWPTNLQTKSEEMVTVPGAPRPCSLPYEVKKINVKTTALLYLLRAAASRGFSCEPAGEALHPCICNYYITHVLIAYMNFLDVGHPVSLGTPPCQGDVACSSARFRSNL